MRSICSKGCGRARHEEVALALAVKVENLRLASAREAPSGHEFRRGSSLERELPVSRMDVKMIASWSYRLHEMGVHSSNSEPWHSQVPEAVSLWLPYPPQLAETDLRPIAVAQTRSALA